MILIGYKNNNILVVFIFDKYFEQSIGRLVTQV